MDEKIQAYSEAVKNFIQLSQEEVTVRVKVQSARARLRQTKDDLRTMEDEMLELKY